MFSNSTISGTVSSFFRKVNNELVHRLTSEVVETFKFVSLPGCLLWVLFITVLSRHG